MNLADQFTQWTADGDRLLLLYNVLLTNSKRAIRPEWKKRFLAARLMPSWPMSQALWRSTNSNVLIVGKDHGTATHKTFDAAGLAILLRSALLQFMAAVDKLLHEALSKHFSTLAKSGNLDALVKLDCSKVYEIAQNARVRTGKGGKKKKRPGHDLKGEMLTYIYTNSYLNTSRLEQVCAARGKSKIFQAYATANPPSTAEEHKRRWSLVYHRRNSIAHECDVVRKAKARAVHFNAVHPSKIQDDVRFVKTFGLFLANELK